MAQPICLLRGGTWQHGELPTDDYNKENRNTSYCRYDEIFNVSLAETVTHLSLETELFPTIISKTPILFNRYAIKRKGSFLI